MTETLTQLGGAFGRQPVANMGAIFALTQGGGRGTSSVYLLRIQLRVARDASSIGLRGRRRIRLITTTLVVHVMKRMRRH